MLSEFRRAVVGQKVGVLGALASCPFSAPSSFPPSASPPPIVTALIHHLLLPPSPRACLSSGQLV